MSKIEKIRLYISSLLIIIAATIFCFSAVNNDFLYVQHFHSKYKKVCLNIELPKNLKNKVSLLVNDSDMSQNECIYWEENRFFHKTDNLNSLQTEYFFPVKSLKIKINGDKKEAEKVINNIGSAIVFVEEKMYFFDNKNIQTFEKTSDKNSTYLTLPNLCESQYKGHINGFVVDFLSSIYCWDKYIFPWILVFLGIIILPRSRIKISCYVTVGIIFLLGAILRLNESAQYPLWFDELVLFFKAGGNYYDKYFGVLDDMSNPPLINILYKIFSRFSYDGEFFRTIFAIIGSFGIFSVYLLAKDRISKKVGLISALVTTVSIYAISFSQICRSYNVAFVLAPVFVFFMFRALETKKITDYIGMAVFGILLINTHLYCIIFLFVNFLYGIYYIALKKDKNYRNFILSFFIIGLSFLPFLITVMIKGNYFAPEFQSWIENCSAAEILLQNFGPTFTLAILTTITIAAAFFKEQIFPDFNDKQKEFVNYLIYFFISFYVTAFVIAGWKDILSAQYFYFIYGFEIIFISIFAEMKYKFFSWILILYVISTQSFNTSFYSLLTYRELGSIISEEAKRHKMVYVFNNNFSEFFPYNKNALWVNDDIYCYKHDYIPNKTNLQHFVEMFNTGKNSVFLINVPSMHHLDKEFYFDKKYSEKYDLSLIQAPYYHILKIEPKK